MGKRKSKQTVSRPLVLTGAANKGMRGYQEDRHLMISAEEGLIMVVMDGHGDAACAIELESKFCEVWDSVFSSEKTPDFLFKELFDKFDMLTSGMECGSTMSVAFIPKANTGKETKVHVAILGDSPVIVQQPDGTFHVSPEHNVRTNMAERAAAQARGGYYSSNGYICYGPEGHGLQMSRAFGDRDLGKILCRQPEVYSVDLGGWVLVGSDGLLSPGHDESGVQMLLDIVKMIEEQDVNAKELVDYAVSIPTGDNVTAILWRRS
jgi:serine/threonine protein phosphatase PrpC